MACVGSGWVEGRGVVQRSTAQRSVLVGERVTKQPWVVVMVVVVVVVVRGLKLVGGGLGSIEDMVVHSK